MVVGRAAGIARGGRTESDQGLKRWAAQAARNQHATVSTLLVSDMDELFEVWNPKNCIMEGYLEKRGIGGEVVWFQRRAMFDREKFSIGKLDSHRVLDYILLKDIIKIRKIEFQPDHATPELTGRMLPPQGQTILATPNARQSRRVRNSISIEADELMTTFDASKSAFEIETAMDSRHVGTKYVFRANTEVECSEWVQKMGQAVRLVKMRLEKERFGTFNEKARKFLGPLHESDVFQLLVVLMIIANFMVNLAEAQFLPPPGSDEERIYITLDTVFTGLFAIELALNIYVNWWRPFLSNGWSVFDLFVVSTSLLAIVWPEIPAVNVLRLVRIFRVFRLFQWFRSLKIIINAVTAAIFPVFSSFIVLFLVTCIYAMMAHNLFKESNPERFGNFSSSLFTMFQVCTGDGWAEAVVRPMFPRFNATMYAADVERAERDPNFVARVPGIDGPVALFFVSFVLIVGITLLNIVVAVLLDEFITSVSSEKAENDRIRAEKKLSTLHRMQGTLDPILVTLANYNNLEDLNDRIERLYISMNEEDSPGGLGFTELHNGLKKLQTETPINFEQEDWEIVTENLELCNEEEKLDASGFKIMLKRQLKLFVQRQMVNAMCQSEVVDPHRAAIFFVLKQLTVSFDEVAGAVMSLVDDSYEPLRGADGFMRTPSEFSSRDDKHPSFPRPRPRPAAPRFLGDTGRADSFSSDKPPTPLQPPLPRKHVEPAAMRDFGSFRNLTGGNGSFLARGGLGEVQQAVQDVSAKLDLRLDDLARRVDALAPAPCPRCGHRHGSVKPLEEEEHGEGRAGAGAGAERAGEAMPSIPEAADLSANPSSPDPSTPSSPSAALRDPNSLAGSEQHKGSRGGSMANSPLPRQMREAEATEGRRQGQVQGQGQVAAGARVSPSMAQARAHQFLRMAWHDTRHRHLHPPPPHHSHQHQHASASCKGCGECRGGCAGVGAVLYDEHGVLLRVDGGLALELREAPDADSDSDQAGDEAWEAGRLSGLLRAYCVRTRDTKTPFDVPAPDGRHTLRYYAVKVSAKHLPVAPAALEVVDGAPALASPHTALPATIDALTRSVLARALDSGAVGPTEAGGDPGAEHPFLFSHAAPTLEHPRVSVGRDGRERSLRRPVLVEGDPHPLGGKRRTPRPASLRPDEDRNLMLAINRRMGRLRVAPEGADPAASPAERARSHQERPASAVQRPEMRTPGRPAANRVSLQAHFGTSTPERARKAEGKAGTSQSKEPGARRDSTESRDGRELAALLSQSRRQEGRMKSQERAQGEETEGAEAGVRGGIWPANVRASSNALEGSALAGLL